MELLPSEDLLQIVESVVNRHLAGYSFDRSHESFIVRGPNLIYYPDIADLPDNKRDGARTVMYVTQTIDRVEGGEVTAVKIGHITGGNRQVKR